MIQKTKHQIRELVLSVVIASLAAPPAPLPAYEFEHFLWIETRGKRERTTSVQNGGNDGGVDCVGIGLPRQ